MTDEMNRVWQREGTTGILSLPGSGNYLYEPDFMPIDELRDCLGEPGLKGVIVRGSGRHFSAGADLQRLRQLANDEALLYRKMTAGKKLLELINNTPLPIVAEISGACFGGGLEIALACHIRICSETALFAFPEASLGILPGLGGTFSLPKVIGEGKAAEMILTGDVINAEKAGGLKLIDHVVPARQLHEFTLSYLDKLTGDKEVEVIRAVMQSIINARSMDTDRAMESETRLFCSLAARNMND